MEKRAALEHRVLYQGSGQASVLSERKTAVTACPLSSGKYCLATAFGIFWRLPLLVVGLVFGMGGPKNYRRRFPKSSIYL